MNPIIEMMQGKQQSNPLNNPMEMIMQMVKGNPQIRMMIEQNKDKTLGQIMNERNIRF